MNTYPVNIENVRPREIGRYLGFTLGLLIVGAMIGSFFVGLSVVGFSDFLRGYTITSVAITTCLITFGVLLLLPQRKIRSVRALRYLFYVLAVVFAWRCVSTVMMGIEEGVTGFAIIVTSSVLGICLLIASWNVVAVMNKKGEQDAAPNLFPAESRSD